MPLFRPMLAGTHTDIKKLRFPLLASQKLDGVRATMQKNCLLSRTLKPIPNANVQELFNGLPDGIDGELVVGDPLAPDAYRKTVSLVMSDDKPLDWFKGEKLRLLVFDQYHPTDDFSSRLLSAACARNGFDPMGAGTASVPHILIQNYEQLCEYVDPAVVVQFVPAMKCAGTV